jgi:hypothetical protein
MNGAVRGVLALAIMSGITLGAPLLRADAAQNIDFSATDAGCPDPGFVNARFWQLVGEGAQSAGRAVVTVSKSEAEEYEFLIRIENGAEVGQRKFSASSCPVGAATAALIIAISLFPERANDLEQRSQALNSQTPVNDPPEPRAAAGNEPRAQTQARATPATDAPPRADSRPSPGVAARREWHGVLSISGGVDGTSLPDPSAGLAPAVGIQIHRTSIELGVARYRNQTLQSGDQRGALFTLMTLGGHACYALLTGSLSLGPCAGATFVRLVGDGFGTQRDHERVGVYGGPALGVVARWTATDWLTLRFYAESFIALARPQYELEGERIHRPAIIGVSAFVGPELRL